MEFPPKWNLVIPASIQGNSHGNTSSKGTEPSDEKVIIIIIIIIIWKDQKRVRKNPNLMFYS